MTTPAPVYLTAEHSICTAGGTLLTLHPDVHTAETVLELGALGYLYECHLLVDTASPGPEPIVYPSPAARLAAAEAEVARLRAAEADVRARAERAEAKVERLLRRIESGEREAKRLRAAIAEAEERAAGPFFATCDGLDDAEYGRRLEPVMDMLCERLGERLEEEYEPQEWARVVAGWAVTVAHGVHLRPRLDDDGEPQMDLGSAAGWWDYDLRLTVTGDGQPVLTAERRAGGAR